MTYPTAIILIQFAFMYEPTELRHMFRKQGVRHQFHLQHQKLTWKIKYSLFFNGTCIDNQNHNLNRVWLD
jgi:hypothetical protein